MELVKVDVGGALFRINAKHLSRFKESTLTKAVREKRNFHEETGSYVFDRNPEHFNAILDCYRFGRYHIPQNACALNLKAEFEFWALPLGTIAPCCIRKILEAEDEVGALTVMKEDIQGPLLKYRKEIQTTTGWERAKLKTWLFMEYPRYSAYAKLWSIIYGLLVLLSCVILALVSDHKGSMYNLKDLSEMNQKMCRHNVSRDSILLSSSQAIYCNFIGVLPLRVLDVILNFIFTIDLITRLIVCPEKRVFLKSFMNWVDIVTILSFDISWLLVELGVFELFAKRGIKFFVIAGVLYGIQTLRLIRLLKISRWVLGLRVFGLILHRSVYGLLTIVCLLGMGAAFFAFLAYVVNINYHDADMSDVFDALYFAFITITTVGYGDIVPKTTGTKVISSACAAFGILLTGLSIPILASSFNLYFGYISQYMSSRNDVTIDWLYDDREVERNDNAQDVGDTILDDDSDRTEVLTGESHLDETNSSLE